MEIRLLGPLEVRDGERLVTLPRRQQRALLAALALRAGEVVSTDRLTADLWGERAPTSATGSLQNTVSALRKLLGRDVLVTQAPGYRLAVDRAAVDSNRFEGLLAQAREAEPVHSVRLLAEAIELWRGPALADLDDHEFARLEAARLEELRVTAVEERIDAELELGRHAALVGQLEQLVATHPLRERLRGQLMLALYRCGRQAEALEVYRAARLALADELGLDPSPELQELERRILRQDPELATPVEAAAETPPREVAELRLVTVLAASPPAAEDPEQHRRLLDETLESVREALAGHGGELERFGPEGLVVVFGADGPRDDDAARAVAVARELGLPAGVATGEVVQGAGTVVTRAVELARSKGIALDDRTRALVSSTRRLDAPLVGRAEELARLRTALAASREADHCRAVTVVGEAGIGKTRLARELAHAERDQATVLVARCVAHGDGATFLPLLAALRGANPEHVLAAEPDAELVLSRLGALAEGRPTASLGESYWAIRRLLEALAREQAVLLVLDDAHWAEPALVDLVEYLADRADAPVLVLSLARPELERPVGEVIALGPLAAGDARMIVAGTAEVDDETRERIVALAEGNALYAEQLASFAAEGGEGLPPTLEAVLAGRLGRLAPSERAILQRAAVLGREFSMGAVAALADGEVAPSLLALSRAGLVHPAPAADPGDDGYAFHHVLLRDAAYTTLTKSDRADLHERAAEWLDRRERVDDVIVGHHLELATLARRALGEPADELAVAAGQRLGEAGMRVWRQNDTGAAIGLFRRSLALLPPGERRAELGWELAIALRNSSDPDWSDVLDHAGDDAGAANSKPVAARVESERARWHVLTGDSTLADAAAKIGAAVEVLEGAGDDRGLGRSLLALASVHNLACNHAELRVAAERARDAYVRAGFSPAAAIGMYVESLYYGSVPVDRAALECAQLLEDTPDRMTEANILAVLATLRAAVGAAAEGRPLLAASRDRFDELGNTLGLHTVWGPLALEFEVFAGDYDAAERVGRTSFEALAAMENRAYASTLAAHLAVLSVDGGDARAARALVEYAEEHAIRTDVFAQILWRTSGSRLALLEGDGPTAEQLAREAVAVSAHTDALRERARAHAALAAVLDARGLRADADGERSEAARLLREKGIVAATKEGASLGPLSMRLSS